MAPDDAPCFTPELFAFLRELAANNERPWFQANKARYEADLKEPALAFIEDIAFRLPEAAPSLTADPKSLFRIYRDTRFAKDKTPYKTHAGIHLRHAQAADTPAPGVYLHLEPRQCFMGAGIWHPESAPLKRIRTAIVNRPDAWRAAVADVAPAWSLSGGDPLKRAPVGFPPDHPLIADLRRRSFAVISPMTQRDATGRGFLDTFEERLRTARPFLAFLSDALGVEYA